MSYCINAYCPDPDNAVEDTRCHTCGTQLRLGQSNFRSLTPLTERSQDATLNHKVKVSYEAEDAQHNPAVLEVFEEDGARVSELFERLVELHRTIQHPGIAKYIDHFPIVTGDGKRLNCLVREKITGYSLKDYLDEHGTVPLEQALHWFREICEILEVVHRRGFKHLDIKPDNILLTTAQHLVLIDFSDGYDAISFGYSPPEQANGNPTIQSDFFALGRTIMHLLTGKQPLFITKDSRTKQLQWQTDCPTPIPSGLASMLEALVQPEPSDRPQSAKEILRQLDDLRVEQSITQLQAKWQIQRWVVLGMGISAGVVLSWLWPSFYRPIQTKFREAIAPRACQPNQNARLSCGEKSIMPGSQNLKPEKAQGIEAYREQRYDDAIQLFEEARDVTTTDPETLIFLNNARIQSENFYTIAIAAPLNVNAFLSNNILRGIAQLQDEINNSPEKIHGRPLQILLATDGNDESIAESVAQELSRTHDIVGIVGHYASEISLAAAPIYEEAQIPMISFGSTSRELTCSNLRTCPQNIFFRVVSTTSENAYQLASHAKRMDIQQKVAVLYNPRSAFSQSLKTEFNTAIKTIGGQLDYETSLCEQGEDFDITQIEAEFRQRNISAVALFPDGQTCQPSSVNVSRLMNILNGRYPILNDSVFHNSGLFRRITPEAYQRASTSSQWHYLHSPESSADIHTQFIKNAQTLWGPSILVNNGITSVTATTYDAGKVLVEALKQKPAQPQIEDQRRVILNRLRDRSVTTMGVTGSIQFQGSDRIDHDLVMLRALKPECQSPDSNRETNLVPLEYNETQDTAICPAIATP